MGAVESVRYSHAFSGPLLSDYFIRRAVQTGRVPRPGEGERLQAAGSCTGCDVPAVEEWVIAGRAGHEPVCRTQLGDSDGHVVCRVTGRRAWIEWTASRFGIYAIASGSSYVALLRWWQSEAGPLY